MMAAGLNCPKSSGMGRLFDGVAAILGIKLKASYEGQGAVLLEAAASSDTLSYPVVLDGEPLVSDWREMIRAIVRDKENGVTVGAMAARFMNTLIEMAVQTAKAAGADSGLDRVCLSGGSFQNMYIMSRLPERLAAEGFKVYHHSRVSTNDEGISLGQLMIANARLKD
jgi:hydrogenase maturation protein HypF